MQIKYIRKLSLFTLLIVFTFVNIFKVGASECKIKNSPAPTLLEYFKNVDSVLTNIRIARNDGPINTWRTYAALNYVVWSLWKIVNLWDIMSWFDFYISLPLTNEVPNEILRDHTMLLDKTEELIDLYKSDVSAWYWDIYIEDACSWVDNCVLKWTIKQLYTKLVDNNKTVTKYYRYIILDKRYILSTDVQFVPSNFSSEMWEYYSKETLTSCSRYEWWFFKTIMEKIASIGKIFSEWYDWYDDWIIAFDLLKWIDKDNEEKEKKILKDYLSSIWMKTKHSDVIMGNLEKYNLWWVSLSDPITNSVNYSFNEVKETIDIFKSALTQQFIANWDSEQVATNRVIKTLPKVKNTYDLKNKILSMYKNEIYYAIPQDLNTESLQISLVEMHFWLIDSIKILSETVRFSEKVCNQQCSWKWKCSFKQ